MWLSVSAITTHHVTCIVNINWFWHYTAPVAVLNGLCTLPWWMKWASIEATLDTWSNGCYQSYTGQFITLHTYITATGTSTIKELQSRRKELWWSLNSTESTNHQLPRVVGNRRLVTMVTRLMVTTASKIKNLLSNDCTLSCMQQCTILVIIQVRHCRYGRYSHGRTGFGGENMTDSVLDMYECVYSFVSSKSFSS